MYRPVIFQRDRLDKTPLNAGKVGLIEIVPLLCDLINHIPIKAISILPYACVPKILTPFEW